MSKDDDSGKRPQHEIVKIVAANVASLRDFRETAGIRALAKKYGIGEATLARMLAADAAVRLDSVAKVAEGLEVEPWQLLVPDLNPARLPALVDPRARVPGLTLRQQALFDRLREMDDDQLGALLELLGLEDPSSKQLKKAS